MSYKWKFNDDLKGRRKKNIGNKVLIVVSLLNSMRRAWLSLLCFVYKKHWWFLCDWSKGRVAPHPHLPRTSPILALKVPHPWISLDSIQIKTLGHPTSQKAPLEKTGALPACEWKKLKSLKKKKKKIPKRQDINIWVQIILLNQHFPPLDSTYIYWALIILQDEFLGLRG